MSQQVEKFLSLSQYFNSKSTVIQTVFPSTKQNDEMIFVILCDAATVTNL